MRFSFIAAIVVLASAVPTSNSGDLDNRIESISLKLQELEKDTVVERMPPEHTRESRLNREPQTAGGTHTLSHYSLPRPRILGVSTSGQVGAAQGSSGQTAPPPPQPSPRGGTN